MKIDQTHGDVPKDYQKIKKVIGLSRTNLNYKIFHIHIMRKIMVL